MSGAIASRGGQWRRHFERPGQTATAIAQVPAPALTCVAGITGEGRDGKAAIVLIVVLLVRVSKLISNSLNFLVLVLP
jgi:hypothetical protein